MKYCAHCGHQIQDDAQFCEKCGAAANANTANFAEEKEFLDNTYRFLKYERISWKIVGIFALVISILLFVFTILVFAGAAELVVDAETQALFGLGMISLVMVLYSLIFLPFAIIGLVSAKKIQRCMDGMYHDIRPTAQRCNSIGMLILSIFFNEIALIFYIINFARFKSGKQVVERIAQRQQGQ